VVFKEDIKTSLGHYTGVEQCNAKRKQGRNLKTPLGGGKKREILFTAKISSDFMIKRYTTHIVNEITKERGQ